jgi:hypothetical protein
MGLQLRGNVPDMRAYSLDPRQKVVAAVERGDSTIEEVAASFTSAAGSGAGPPALTTGGSSPSTSRRSTRR